MQDFFDTICAIATPLSASSVGIIRLSGDKSFEISQKIFSRKIQNNKINHGWIVDGDKKIDEVILLSFVAPNSFTGEDVIEIQTHGSPVILKEIMNLLIRCGAKQAQRGEFSKRAFLNHKIDMTQAEAILDLIHAKTSKFASSSANNLSGALTKKINDIKAEITEIFAKVTASVDFPEDVAEIEYDEIESVLVGATKKIDDILKFAHGHNILREGIKIAILGQVNVGKSSLFNSLLNLDRAIVTEIEGTTRDVITESFDINGINVTLIDTAGVRDCTDKVEKIGITNALEYVRTADLTLCLFDGTKGLQMEDEEIFKNADKKILVATKKDIKNYAGEGIINISSKTADGICELKDAIYKKITEIDPIECEFSTNQRQQECLMNSKQAIETALCGVRQFDPQDLILIDIKSSLLALDEITGEVLTDNILDKIFDKFCIGK